MPDTRGSRVVIDSSSPTLRLTRQGRRDRIKLAGNRVKKAEYLDNPEERRVCERGSEKTSIRLDQQAT